MKTRRNNYEDFSKQFNNMTLQDIIKSNKIALEKEINLSQQTPDMNKYFKEWCIKNDNGSGFAESFFEMRTIRPRRFVWHLTLKSNRESIIQNGILPGKNKFRPVFANNSDQIGMFFPFVWDESMIDDCFCHDYWRIDTLAFGAEWRIDPNMYHDMHSCMLGRNSSFWICTPNKVPANAIRLFTHIGYKRWTYDGSAWPVTNNLYEFLRPDRNVNERIVRLSGKEAA